MKKIIKEIKNLITKINEFEMKYNVRLQKNIELQRKIRKFNTNRKSFVPDSVKNKIENYLDTTVTEKNLTHSFFSLNKLIETGIEILQIVKVMKIKEKCNHQVKINFNRTNCINKKTQRNDTHKIKKHKQKQLQKDKINLNKRETHNDLYRKLEQKKNQKKFKTHKRIISGKVINKFLYKQKRETIKDKYLKLKQLDKIFFYHDAEGHEFVAQDKILKICEFDGADFIEQEIFYRHLNDLKYGNTKYPGVITIQAYNKILNLFQRMAKRHPRKIVQKCVRKRRIKCKKINERKLEQAKHHCCTLALFEITNCFYSIKSIKRFLKKYQIGKMKNKLLRFSTFRKILKIKGIHLKQLSEMNLKKNSILVKVSKSANTNHVSTIKMIKKNKFVSHDDCVKKVFYDHVEIDMLLQKGEIFQILKDTDTKVNTIKENRIMSSDSTILCGVSKQTRKRKKKSKKRNRKRKRLNVFNESSLISRKKTTRKSKSQIQFENLMYQDALLNNQMEIEKCNLEQEQNEKSKDFPILRRSARKTTNLKQRRTKERQRRYNQSEKKKEGNKRNNSTDKKKECNKKYTASEKKKEANRRNNSTDKKKECNKKYTTSEKKKEANRRNNSTDKKKECNKKYTASEKKKAANKRNNSTAKKKECNKKYGASEKKKEANNRNNRSRNKKQANKRNNQKRTTEERKKMRDEHRKEYGEVVKKWYRKARIEENFDDLTEKILKEEHLCETHKLKDQVCCAHCRAQKWPKENKRMCCDDGRIKIAPIKPPPEAIQNLFTEGTSHAKLFREHARTINNSLAFTSINAKQKRLTGNGPPNWTIQGSFYHRAGGLLKMKDSDCPRCAQIYFYAQDDQCEERLKYVASEEKMNKHRDDFVKILKICQNALEECNPLIKRFKQIVHENEFKNFANLKEQIKIKLHGTSSNRYSHSGRYNLAGKHDVGILIPGQKDDSTSCSRDVILNLRDGDTQIVSNLNPLYDPLQYVLLFPHGDKGFEIYERKKKTKTNEKSQKKKKRKKKGKKKRKDPTSLQYYRYRLMWRDDEFNTILRSCQLLDQYVCDMWNKIETQNLSFLANNQKDLKANLYDACKQSIENNDDGKKKGKEFKLLPPTFIGGTRYMSQKFQDAMSIVRKHGQPDLFLTMTANPNWKEVRDKCQNSQKSWQRRDLVCRVFKQKLDSAMKDIRKGVLGQVKSLLYTIEFQKRGLPHAHILIIFDEKDKIKTTADLDQIICAEIPDKKKMPDLFNIVKELHIHGPCCQYGSYKNCQKYEGIDICKKNFPRPFADETKFNEDGYPSYRRRPPSKGGNSFLKGGCNNLTSVDNRWVAPYNPWFAKKYQCHFFFESCTTVRAIKYIYKYCHKGTDRAKFSIENEDICPDEIKNYIDARYLSSSESFWRIFEFSTNKRLPAVVPLAVHAKDKQMVYQREDQTLEEAMQSAENTSLTTWFDQNKIELEYKKEHGCDLYSPPAYTITYPNFPQFYTLSKGKDRKWTRRENIQTYGTIGRMHFASPNQGERFFLRQLLYRDPGATCYDDLLKHGTSTFQEECIERNLTSGTINWSEAIQEAECSKFDKAFRNFFITLLIWCKPPNPDHLWEEFKESLCESTVFKIKKKTRTGQYTTEQISEYAENIVLEYFEEQLKEINENLEDYKLPNPTSLKLKELSKFELKQAVYEPSETWRKYATKIQKMSTEQKDIFDEISHHISGEIPLQLFLHASAGTGKTFMFNTILEYCRAGNIPVVPVATSGIASLLFEGGRTINSKFRIIPPITKNSISEMVASPKSHAFEMMKECKVILWDEIVMAHKYLIEALDRSLRKVCENDEPFGGKIIIFAGDSKQLLPVVGTTGVGSPFNASLVQSPLWNSIQIRQLTKNFRLLQNRDEMATDESLKYQKEIEEFELFQHQIGKGTYRNLNVVNHPELPNDLIKIPDKYISQSENREQLIDEIFPLLHVAEDNYFKNHDSVILSTLNQTTLDINQIAINKMPQPKRTFKSIDTLEDDDNPDIFPPKFLNSCTPNNFPRHDLTLCVGCPIICLRNLNPRQGLFNGTRLIVKSFTDHIITAEIQNGANQNKGEVGKIVLIPKIHLTDRSDKEAFRLMRYQFPVRLCFAMTVHKSQGQQFDSVALYLNEPVFCHGQMYTAVSRTKNPRKLKILIQNVDYLQGNVLNNNEIYVPNIVNKRIFQCVNQKIESQNEYGDVNWTGKGTRLKRKRKYKPRTNKKPKTN